MHQNTHSPSRDRDTSKNRADSSNSNSDSESERFSDSELFTIFVNNIDPEVPEEKLKKFFSNFGRVVKFRLEKENPKKFYAFVTYDHSDYGKHNSLFLIP